MSLSFAHVCNFSILLYPLVAFVIALKCFLVMYIVIYLKLLVFEYVFDDPASYGFEKFKEDVLSGSAEK